jgi:hypothetical protein
MLHSSLVTMTSFYVHFSILSSSFAPPVTSHSHHLEEAHQGTSSSSYHQHDRNDKHNNRPAIDLDLTLHSSGGRGVRQPHTKSAPPPKPKVEPDLPFEYTYINHETGESTTEIGYPIREKMALIDLKRKERVQEGLLLPVEYQRMSENDAIMLDVRKRIKAKAGIIRDPAGHIMLNPLVGKEEAMKLQNDNWLDQVKDAGNGHLELVTSLANKSHQREEEERHGREIIFQEQKVTKKHKKQGYNPVMNKWMKYQTIDHRINHESKTPPPSPPSSPEQYSSKIHFPTSKVAGGKSLDLFPDLLGRKVSKSNRRSINRPMILMESNGKAISRLDDNAAVREAMSPRSVPSLFRDSSETQRRHSQRKYHQYRGKGKAVNVPQSDGSSSSSS